MKKHTCLAYKKCLVCEFKNVSKRTHNTGVKKKLWVTSYRALLVQKQKEEFEVKYNR